MCLLIVKPQNVTIPQEFLVNGFANNDHGAGIAYNDGSLTYIHKGFFDFDSFMKVYQKQESMSCIIHFRLATHGDINVENCHPFDIGGGWVAAHNGILKGYGSLDKSDTRDYLAKKITPKRLLADFASIEKEIGLDNKMAFMSSIGSIKIANESQGDWKDGVWFSNKSYLKEDYYSYSLFDRKKPYETDFYDGESWEAEELLENLYRVDLSGLSHDIQKKVSDLICSLEWELESREYLEEDSKGGWSGYR